MSARTMRTFEWHRRKVNDTQLGFSPTRPARQEWRGFLFDASTCPFESWFRCVNPLRSDGCFALWLHSGLSIVPRPLGVRSSLNQKSNFGERFWRIICRRSNPIDASRKIWTSCWSNCSRLVDRFHRRLHVPPLQLLHPWEAFNGSCFDVLHIFIRQMVSRHTSSCCKYLLHP